MNLASPSWSSEPSAELQVAIEDRFGGLDGLKEAGGEGRLEGFFFFWGGGGWGELKAIS